MHQSKFIWIPFPLELDYLFLLNIYLFERWSDNCAKLQPRAWNSSCVSWWVAGHNPVGRLLVFYQDVYQGAGSKVLKPARDAGVEGDRLACCATVLAFRELSIVLHEA